MKLWYLFVLIFITYVHAASNTVYLTPEEKQWIADHPKIVLGIEESWAPMVIKNSDGTFSGIDADTVTYLNKILGTDITFKVGKWSILDEMFKRKELDGLSSSSNNPKRATYANFTNHYTTIIKSIFVKKGNTINIRKPEDLSGKKVAVQEGNFFDEKLVQQYQNTKIVYGKNYQTLANLVLSKKADAFVGSDLTNYNLQDIGITSIEPASTIGEPLELVFAIRQDWPKLIPILNKGLATLSQNERKAIKDKYFAKPEPFDYSLLWKIALGFIALVLALVWWNRFLARKVEEGIEKYKRQEQQLIEQSKMAAMGEMIGAISHQLKQPLNVVALYAFEIKAIIEYENSDKERLLDTQKGIMKQIDYMNTTINDFRNFFKPSTEVTTFKPCRLAQEVYNLIEAKMKSHSIEFTIEGHDCFEITGLPNECKQVILNIYNNACDILEEREIENRHIHVLFEKTDDKAIMRIRDNGGGIPAELLPDKLFEPYVSTKGEKGTGIGLQISKTIIKDKFNGKLWVHNVEDGAEFVIEFPLVK